MIRDHLLFFYAILLRNFGSSYFLGGVYNHDVDGLFHHNSSIGVHHAVAIRVSQPPSGKSILHVLGVDVPHFLMLALPIQK